MKAFHFARVIKAQSKSALSHFLLSQVERQSVPQKFVWRNRLFKFLPSLFMGNPTFELWKKADAYFISQRPKEIEWIYLDALPIPSNLPIKKIAIHAHIFYNDLVPELIENLVQFPRSYDLLVSTPHNFLEQSLREQLANLPNLSHLEILITPNRGRDVGPMLYGFGKQLLSYDYFAHLHTKKSTGTNDIGDAWRQYLWNGLLNNSHHQVLKILGLLEHFGLVYPHKFHMIDIANCQWENNLAIVQPLCQDLSLPSPKPGFIEFPVGTMFWANTRALKPLLEHSFTPESFAPEEGQTDNTIMHALERLFGHIALSQSLPIAVLTDPQQRPYYP